MHHDELDLVQSVRDCRHLYVLEIGEPRDNSLRIVIFEGRTDGDQGDDLGPDLGPLVTSVPLTASRESRGFELLWETYVAYSVRNESFTGTDEYELFDGHLLVQFSRSHYLDFVGLATFAKDVHPGALQHWGLFCLNHTIDVVSLAAPQIRRCSPGLSASSPGGSRPSAAG